MALVSQRSGCKVGWDVYDNEDEARAAAVFQASERERKFALGYDFGYLWPGSVAQLPDGNWQVVTV